MDGPSLGVFDGETSVLGVHLSAGADLGPEDVGLGVAARHARHSHGLTQRHGVTLLGPARYWVVCQDCSFRMRVYRVTQKISKNLLLT